MTKVTTFTEYTDEEGRRIVNAYNDQGFSGGLVFDNDEAIITMRVSGEDPMEWCEHPEDALAQFIAQFFEY